MDWDAEDIRDVVYDSALAGLQRRPDVRSARESDDPDSRLVTVEMANGRAFYVDLQVGVTEA